MASRMSTTSSATSWTSRQSTRTKVWRERDRFKLTLVHAWCEDKQNGLFEVEVTFLRAVSLLILFVSTSRHSWHPCPDPGKSHHRIAVLHSGQLVPPTFHCFQPTGACCWKCNLHVSSYVNCFAVYWRALFPLRVVEFTFECVISNGMSSSFNICRWNQILLWSVINSRVDFSF